MFFLKGQHAQLEILGPHDPLPLKINLECHTPLVLVEKKYTQNCIKCLTIVTCRYILCEGKSIDFDTLAGRIREKLHVKPKNFEAS